MPSELVGLSELVESECRNGGIFDSKSEASRLSFAPNPSFFEKTAKTLKKILQAEKFFSKSIFWLVCIG